MLCPRPSEETADGVWSPGPHGFGPSWAAAPGHQQQAGLEVEQQELEQVLVWDAADFSFF